MHTCKASPSPPGAPRVQIIPVKNSFDVVSDQPARLDLMVTWTPAQANGSAVQRYQVHVKRFDHEGCVLYDDPPLLKKKALPDISNKDKAIGKMVKLDRRANQWTQSKGKSLQQIHNSVTSRSQSPTRLRSKSPMGRDSVDESHLPSPAGFRASTASGSAAWKIVYDNLSRSVRLGSPFFGDGTWWMRIRARNALGWSEFSPITVISRASHPTLFSMPSAKGSVTVRPPSRDSHLRASASSAEELSPVSPTSVGHGGEEKPQTPFSRFEQHLKGRQSTEEAPVNLLWGRHSVGGGTLMADMPSPSARPLSRPSNSTSGLDGAALPAIVR